jgi:hypothetical protein
MAKKHTRRVSLFDAIALHAEANKSDPFAAKRMAMTLRNRNDKPKEVHAEATRLIAANAKRIERTGAADWVSDAQHYALSTLRNGLVVALKKRAPRKQKLSMSMFANRADYDAAVAA